MRVTVETPAQRVALASLVARQFSERSQAVLWPLALGVSQVDVPCTRDELAEAYVRETSGVAFELIAIVNSESSLMQRERQELMQRTEGLTELMCQMRAEEPPASLQEAA